jgi:hypothetical protein
MHMVVNSAAGWQDENGESKSQLEGGATILESCWEESSQQNSGMVAPVQKDHWRLGNRDDRAKGKFKVKLP